MILIRFLEQKPTGIIETATNIQPVKDEAAQLPARQHRSGWNMFERSEDTLAQ